MINISFDFKKRVIIMAVGTEKTYDALRAQRRLSEIGCCEVASYVFEIPATMLYELNDILGSPEFKGLVSTDEKFKSWVKEANVQRPVIIQVHPVTSKIIPGNITLPVVKLETATRYFLKAAVNMDKYKSGKWDGYINLYNRRDRTFLTGLLNLVVNVLKEADIPYHIEFLYDKEPKRMYNWVVNDGLTPDPDQVDAIEAALKGKRGIIKAPTGFGKTAILAKRLTAAFAVPTLFVANKKSLLDDAAEEFRDGIDGLRRSDVIQIKDGWFGDIKLTPQTTRHDVKPITAPVVVATIQSLHARLEDPRTAPYLKAWLNTICKFVMIDETQAVGTKIWDEVLSECRAPYRIALSATPRRTDGATIKIQAYSGPNLFFTTAAEQIEKGRLCELNIMYLPYDHKLYNDDDADINYAEMYRMCIIENEDRNRECVVKPVLSMIEEGRHVLVLIQMIDHGAILQRMLMEAGLDATDIRFIWGETPDKLRTSAIQEFRKGEFKVMIGSTIFDAGVNIPIISGVVLAGAGNSDITLIQRIGRGARNADYEKTIGYLPEFMKKNHGQKITKVYDVLDYNTKFFHRQSKNRYYNAREEFGADRVHLLGEDDSMLSKRKKKISENRKKIDQFSAQLEMLDQFAR